MSWGADRLRLIDLGDCEPLKAQTFYEAVAVAVDRGLSPDTLVLCRPSSPYVCIGYHRTWSRRWTWTSVGVPGCR